MLAILRGLLAGNIFIVLICCIQVWLLCKGCAPVLRQVLLNINGMCISITHVRADLIKHYALSALLMSL